MRIGVVWDPAASANAYYRAIDPVRAMERRGHQVVGPADGRGQVDVARLTGCDVVHVFRLLDPQAWKGLHYLAAQGTGLVYDNDDNIINVPKESPTYKQMGGKIGRQVMALTFATARRCDVFTTTTEALADLYRRNGVRRAEVIPNYVAPDIARPRVPHDGLVIGWVANLEHRLDAMRIDVAGALRRIVEQHPHVRVHCIGVDLGLPERYRFTPSVAYEQLATAMGDWDIGIAPLVEHPFNLTRSDIKLKEYAACGMPWLASPVGPYAGLGEEQGGRLVPHDRWFEELDRLVSSLDERAALAARARAWAAANLIDRVADRWERVFAEAAGRSPALAAAQPGAPRMVVRLPKR